jgi:hypothetical protein
MEQDKKLSDRDARIKKASEELVLDSTYFIFEDPRPLTKDEIKKANEVFRKYAHPAREVKL